MKTGTDQNESFEALSREQLLSALDNEIDDATSVSTSSGWNYWAILGALGALLWLTIDAWQAGNFVLKNVLLLTLAMSMAWDAIRSIASQLDQSPLGLKKDANRFRPITPLLGSARSMLVFVTAKNVTFLSIALFLSLPLFWPVKFQYMFLTAACLMAIWISYVDFPPLPEKPTKMMRAFFSCLSIFASALTGSALLSLGGVIWLLSSEIQAHDVRLSLLATAILYLLTLAVQNRIPEMRLTTLRSLRHNLAFSRISLSEAQAQVDLLFIGTTLTQALQPKFNEVMAAYETSMVSMNRVKNMKTYYNEQLALFISQLKRGEAPSRQCVDVAHKQFLGAIDEFLRLQGSVNKKVEQFAGLHGYLVNSSDVDRSSAEHFIEELRAISTRAREQWRQFAKEAREEMKLTESESANFSLGGEHNRQLTSHPTATVSAVDSENSNEVTNQA